ncbi:YncE family protein [Roseomonas elaeocarpi]|uniref:YncE family protein n=1 Tax=Roseomonas elaeocarpi TaxID=907779 RepID=A0ABV6JYQ2_9PROT
MDRNSRLSRRLLLQHSALAAALLPVAGIGAARAAEAAAVLRQAVGRGLYEIAYSPSRDTLYAAVMGDFEDKKGGRILLLDPKDLSQRGAIEMPLKPFSLCLDEAKGVLYVGHTMDQAMSAVDLAKGEIRGTLRLETPEKHHPREIRLDPAGDRLFVTGIGDPSVVWVVDVAGFAVRSVIKDTGKWAAGLAYDPVTRHLLVGNYDSELVVVDSADGRIVSRQFVGAKDENFLVNITVDRKRRLFYAANSKGSEVFAFNADTLALAHRIPCGKEPLAVVIDAPRDRLIVTNRGAGKASVIALDGYATLRTVEMGDLPNSIAVNPADGTLFLSTKQTLDKKDATYSDTAPDSIIRAAVA